MIFVIEKVAKEIDIVAKTVVDIRAGLMEIAHLCDRAGEVQILDICRLPRAGHRRKSIIDRKLGPARFVENRAVEAEAGTEQDAIIGEQHALPLGVGKNQMDEQL